MTPSEAKETKGRERKWASACLVDANRRTAGTAAKAVKFSPKHIANVTEAPAKAAKPPTEESIVRKERHRQLRGDGPLPVLAMPETDDVATSHVRVFVARLNKNPEVWRAIVGPFETVILCSARNLIGWVVGRAKRLGDYHPEEVGRRLVRELRQKQTTVYETFALVRCVCRADSVIECDYCRPHGGRTVRALVVMDAETARETMAAWMDAL